MKTITLTDEELAIVKEAVDSFQNTLDDWIYRHSHLEMNHTKAKSKLCDDVLKKLNDEYREDEIIADIRNGYAIDYIYDDEQIREQILDKLTLEGCVRDGIFSDDEIISYASSRTYYLLKDCSSYEPYYALGFKKKHHTETIQKEIDRLNDKYWEENADDYQVAYVVKGLVDKYDCDVINLDSDYDLYV